MRHLLTQALALQRRARTDDGQGGTVEIWQTVGIIRGRLFPASVSERMAAAQRQAEVSHTLYTEPTSGVRRGDRVALDGLTVEMLAVRDYEGRYLACDGLAVQNG